jgi:hypothetical protein
MYYLELEILDIDSVKAIMEILGLTSSPDPKLPIFLQLGLNQSICIREIE